MLLVKQAMRLLLAGDTGLAAVVGDRIYPTFLPQKTLTVEGAIAWRRKNRESLRRLSTDKPTSNLLTTWFEFVCVASGPNGDAVAENIDDALFELLEGWSGVISDDQSPESTMQIQGIFQESLEEFYVDNLKTYYVRTLYRVHHSREKRP